jgi:hypothetical protein
MCLWPNFKFLSRHVPRRTEVNHEEAQDSQFPGRDLNPEPPEYEAGVLTARPRHSDTRVLALFCT